MASTDAQITRDRAESVAKSWCTTDANRILSHYSDDEMEFSDFGLGVSKIDKVAFTKFTEETLATWRDTKINVNNVHGPSADGVVTLETTVAFTANKDVKPLAEKDQTLEMPAVMLMRFDQQGKVTMQHDYHCITLGHLMGGAAGQ